MKVLITGASGATGRLVVMHLCQKQIQSRIVIRENAVLPEELLNNKLVEIVKGNIDEFNHSQITCLLESCDAVICCLGHNISLKGIFGKPHRLVYNAIVKINRAAKEQYGKKLKLILMSTTAYTNPENENNSAGEKIIFSLLKIILPPHNDNIEAAEYLRHHISSYSEAIEWAAVRPDSLFNEEKVSEYEVYECKQRSPMFNAGKTSRINAAHFMTELATDDELFKKWKFKFPVVYNKV